MNISYEGICEVGKKKIHNINVPSFRLPACTKCLMANPLNISVFLVWYMITRLVSS